MKTKYEPVRVFAWLIAVLTSVLGVVQQVHMSWDETSGWAGVGVALVTVLGAEYTRSKTRSRESLIDAGVNPDVGTGVLGQHFAPDDTVD